MESERDEFVAGNWKRVELANKMTRHWSALKIHKAGTERLAPYPRVNRHVIN